MAEAKKEDSQSGLILKLSAQALTELRRTGIGARPATSIVFQEKSRRWQIFGTESGGSTKQVGHYVGYVGTEPDELTLSLPIHSLVPNGTHRRVFGASLIRVEMFRYEQSCDLSITHHALISPGENRRPRLGHTQLFLERSGILTPDNSVPLFFSRSGELVDLPEALLPAIVGATKGVQCVNCRHAHLVGVPSIQLSPDAATSPSPAQRPANEVEVVATRAPRRSRKLATLPTVDTEKEPELKTA